MSGEDEREGGARMYYGLKMPLPLPGGKGLFPESPSPMKFVELARQYDDVWIDLEKPFGGTRPSGWPVDSSSRSALRTTTHGP